MDTRLWFWKNTYQKLYTQKAIHSLTHRYFLMGQNGRLVTSGERQVDRSFTFSPMFSIPPFLSNFLLIPWRRQWQHPSSTLAWKIPWTEEPCRMRSTGSLGVGHDWATSLSLFTFMHWRRTWQPTPVFLPGESQGWGSLVGCHRWGRTESDTTEAT